MLTRLRTLPPAVLAVAAAALVAVLLFAPWGRLVAQIGQPAPTATARPPVRYTPTPWFGVLQQQPGWEITPSLGLFTPLSMAVAASAPNRLTLCGTQGTTLVLAESVDGGTTWRNAVQIPDGITRACSVSVNPTNADETLMLLPRVGLSDRLGQWAVREWGRGVNTTVPSVPPEMDARHLLEGGWAGSMPVLLFGGFSDMGIPPPGLNNGPALVAERQPGRFTRLNPFGSVPEITLLQLIDVKLLGTSNAINLVYLQADGTFSQINNRTVTSYLLTSRDGGTTWVRTPFANQGKSLRPVAVLDSTPVVLASDVNAANVLFVSTDAGGTWRSVPNLPFSYNGYGYDTRLAPDGTVVVAQSAIQSQRQSPGTSPIYVLRPGAAAWVTLAQPLPTNAALLGLAWGADGHPTRVFASYCAPATGQCTLLYRPLT